MSRWTPLSHELLFLWELAERTPRAKDLGDRLIDLGSQSELDTEGSVLYSAFCHRAHVQPGIDDPRLNVACLAVQLAEAPSVHVLRPEAVTLAHSTDLRSWPRAAPRLLEGAGLVEASDWRAHDLGVEGPYDGPMVSLGWYHNKGLLWLLGMGRPDWAVCGAVRLRWGQAPEEMPPEHWAVENDAEKGKLTAWTNRALRWLVTLALLLEAHETPARVKQERVAPPKRRQRGVTQRPPVAWSTRTVYLASPPPAQPVQPPPDPSAEPVPTDLSGRTAGLSTVTGHLRMQPHGPGGALRRLQYVAGYEARRWYGAKPTKVVVR